MRPRIAGVVCALVLGAPVFADFELTTVRVASGLARPVFVTAPPADTTRLFIVEAHTGRIKIMNLGTGTISATPFIDLDGLATGGEQGLLSMAFHPDYGKNGFFYVNFTASGGGNTNVVRYTAPDPDQADDTSALTILQITQPQGNHNGGWMSFGPDGYLYIGMGDGGASNDTGSGHTEPGGNAQDITDNPLGKMLRIDIDADDFPADPNRNYAIPPDNPLVGVAGDDEIWAYGLRNPWRNAFDAATGDLYIADVGQGSREEVDFQPAGSTGGQNYGWRCMEGNRCTNLTGCTCDDVTLTYPIHEYDHALGCSITGGYVYRGGEMECLQGTYFFADYCSSKIWSLRYDGVTVSDFTERTAELVPDIGSIDAISSFGLDAAGEMYICDLSGGEIFKIVPRTLRGDMNCDAAVDAADIDLFFIALGDAAAYAAAQPNCCIGLADINRDGGADGEDIDPFFTCLGLGGCP